MDRELLRKVQLVQLEIAKEIKRICEENGISYFLTDGTCLGTVRHKGFIPWDDDLDIGMLRDQYEKFCRIAPDVMNKKYSLQTWYTDPQYANPFGKVRKNGTVYQEAKAAKGGNNGIYVDILVYDNVPEKHVSLHVLKLYILARIILMKCKYRPWSDNGKCNWASRLFYVPFQILACFFKHSTLTKLFDKIATSADNTAKRVHTQMGERHFYGYDRSWVDHTVRIPFEDEDFPVPGDYHAYLSALYGDYMTPPPENQRENMHEIQMLDFGEENE